MIWLLVSLFAGLLLVYYKRTYSYWSSRNVPGPLPVPFLGTLPHMFSVEMRKVDYRLGRKYGPLVGEYFGQTPSLLVSDAALARQLLVSDFHVFSQSQTKDMMPKEFHQMLISLYGPVWKRVRPAVSPTFTTGKLRRTVEHLHKPMRNFTDNLDELIQRGQANQVDIKLRSKGYALDVIAKFVFAIELNSMKQQDDPFVQNARRMAAFRSWVFTLNEFLPVCIGKHILPYGFDLKSYHYLHRLAGEILRKRRENPTVRYQDFVELLLESGDELSEHEMISQCLQFFFAGQDTVSTAMSIAVSDLAIHQGVQQKVLEEIREKLGDAPADYETVRDLDYLDAVVMESMRMTPVLHRLLRIAQADYQLPGTDLVVEKGKMVMFGVYNIHHDERIYPAPFEFRPERFLGDGKKQLQSQAWFAFGAGPKNCVAIRFAMMEIKFFLIQLIRRYRVTMAEGSPVPVQYKKGSFMMESDTLRIKFEHRKEI